MGCPGWVLQAGGGGPQISCSPGDPTCPWGTSLLWVVWAACSSNPDARGVCALPWGSAFWRRFPAGDISHPLGTPTAEPTPRPGAAPREEEAAEGDLQEGAAAGDVLGEALRPARPPPGLLGVPSPLPRSAFVADAACLWDLGENQPRSQPKRYQGVPKFKSSSCFEWYPRDWPRCTGWVLEGGCSRQLDSPELGEEEGEAKKKKRRERPRFQ